MYKEEKRDSQPPKNPTKLGSPPHQIGQCLTHLRVGSPQLGIVSYTRLSLFNDVTWVWRPGELLMSTYVIHEIKDGNHSREKRWQTLAPQRGWTPTRWTLLHTWYAGSQKDGIRENWEECKTYIPKHPPRYLTQAVKLTTPISGQTENGRSIKC